MPFGAASGSCSLSPTNGVCPQRGMSMRGGSTHEVLNQTPQFGGVNLFEVDPLINAGAAGFPDSVRQERAEPGAFGGTHEAREFARLANRETPELERYDASGNRIDQVLFH